MLPRQTERLPVNAEPEASAPPGSVEAIWSRGVRFRYVFLLISVVFLAAVLLILQPATVPASPAGAVLWEGALPLYVVAMVLWSAYWYRTTRCPSCGESLALRGASVEPVRICPYCGAR